MHSPRRAGGRVAPNYEKVAFPTRGAVEHAQEREAARSLCMVPGGARRRVGT
jgi:hypothetical protein